MIEEALIHGLDLQERLAASDRDRDAANAAAIADTAADLHQLLNG